MDKFLKFVLPMVVIIGLVGVAAYMSSQSSSSQQEGKVNTVTSKDGTKIAYDKSGSGPAVILVDGALASRKDHAELAELLSSDFTVYNYDRQNEF